LTNKSMSPIDQCHSVSNGGNAERIYPRMKSPSIAQDSPVSWRD
jgi:hypothetical protein